MPLRNAYIVLFLTFLPLLQPAQNWIWSHKTGYIEARDVKVDNNGNVFTLGQANPAVPVYDSYSLSCGSAHLLIAKHSPPGSVLWATGVMNAGGVQINLDKAGNLYVGGNFYSQVIFYSASCSTVALLAQDNADYFLSKYDPSGNLVWTQNFGYNGEKDYLQTLRTDSIGNTYLVSIQDSTLPSNSSSPPVQRHILSKIDPAGNLIWRKTSLWGGQIRISVMDMDQFGNCYIAGDFSGTIFLDTVALSNTNTFSSTLFLAKFNPNGNYIWSKKESSAIEFTGISLDLKDNIYLTGNFYNTTTFGSTTITNSQNHKMFFVKYDSTGVLQWAKSIPTHEGTTVDAKQNNSIIIGGTFQNSLTLCSGSNCSSLTGFKPNSDIFLAKYDQNDNLVWLISPTANSGVNVGDQPRLICSDNKYYYLTGTFSENTVFSNITLCAPFSWSAPYNMFVAKLDNATFVTKDKEQTREEPQFLVYPVPAIDNLNLDYNSTISCDWIIVSLKNPQGQEVYHDILYHPGLHFNRNIAVHTLPSGVYLLDLKTENTRVVKKVVLK